jgi:hypothetical protein
VLAVAITVVSLIVVLFDHARTPGAKPLPTAVAAGTRDAAVAPSNEPTPAASTPTVPETPVSTKLDSGQLPQTGVFPTTTTPQFSSEMAAFWQAVTSGVPSKGLPAFFPESAYIQVKAILDPRHDWTVRLLDRYYGDIGAAHRLLGPNATSAQLVGVQVYAGTAHWVTPGTCKNRVGYFEVPNSRVVYQVNGQVRSFGITSMISWRGEWYIVHLGAINESPGVPVVDAPSIGPGYPAPLQTC